MAGEQRLQKLEAQIDQLHRDRIIPPLEAYLRTLSVDELRALLAEIEVPQPNKGLTHDN